MAENEKIYVQLRLTPDEAAVLRERGAASNRKLPAEILHRLRASLGRSEPELDALLFAGWPAADVERFVSIGQIAALLCARITLTVGHSDTADTAELELERDLILTQTAAALRELLNSVSSGRVALSPFEEKVAASIGRAMAHELRQSAAMDASPTMQQQPERAVLAEFAKTWAVGAKKTRKGDDNG